MVNAPAYIQGVVNLRGVIVPIIDLRIKLGLPEVRYDHQTVTIVLDIGTRVIGVVVDAVSDVTALAGGDIKAAPEFSGALSTDYIIGVATLKEEQRERMLILMDIEQLISSAEMGVVVHSV